MSQFFIKLKKNPYLNFNLNNTKNFTFKDRFVLQFVARSLYPFKHEHNRDHQKQPGCCQ